MNLELYARTLDPLERLELLAALAGVVFTCAGVTLRHDRRPRERRDALRAARLAAAELERDVRAGLVAYATSKVAEERNSSDRRFYSRYTGGPGA